MITAKGQNGTVHFDGQFVTIERTGFFGRVTSGKGDKRIPVKNIQAVQWKPPGILVNGFIEFTLPGGNEAVSRAGSASMGAAKNENAVIITRKQAPAFEELRAAIEAAMVGQH